MPSTTLNTAAQARTIPVWDPVVRLFHWGLVAAMAVLYLGEEGGSLHERVGYVVLGLVAIRLVWGLVGSRHARFADWFPTPGRVLGYLGQTLRGTAPQFVGHNPLGSVMIVALLAGVTLTAGSGWLSVTDAFWGVEWVEELHEVAAWATLALVPIHVAGVLLGSFLHRENLILAMLSGKKRP